MGFSSTGAKRRLVQMSRADPAYVLRSVVGGDDRVTHLQILDGPRTFWVIINVPATKHGTSMIVVGSVVSGALVGVTFTMFIEYVVPGTRGSEVM